MTDKMVTRTRIYRDADGLTKTEEVEVPVADIAHENFTRTIDAKCEIAKNFLTLGKLLKECLDEGYWKLLGSESFEAYVAQPEIALSRSYAYQVVKLYEVYVQKLGLATETLQAIGPHRLIRLLPAAEDGRFDEEMLGKAASLSLSDLETEYRGEKRHKKREREIEYYGEDYDEWMMSGGCCICGDTGEKSHFPRTRGAGAGESDWIPMCRQHHSEFHSQGVDTFMAGNKYKLFDWFYAKIRGAYKRGGKK